MVSDLLASVAIQASNEAPRRPHTACAGATATVAAEEEDSDGGSFDDECEPAPSRTLAAARPVADAAPVSRALASPGTDEPRALAVEKPAVSASAPKPASATARPAGSGGYPSASGALPTASGARLPKHCVFLGAGAAPGARRQRPKGLVPSAAKYRSHCSWAAFLPMRVPGAAMPSAPTSSAEGPPGTESAAEDAGKAPEASAASAAEAAPAATEPVAEAAPKRPGPKYVVAPGGSRALAKGGSECLTLEFRTQPRVLPAARAVLRPDGVRPAMKVKAGRQESLRFRPSSRTWEQERRMLAGDR